MPAPGPAPAPHPTSLGRAPGPLALPPPPLSAPPGSLSSHSVIPSPSPPAPHHIVLQGLPPLPGFRGLLGGVSEKAPLPWEAVSGCQDEREPGQAWGVPERCLLSPPPLQPSLLAGPAGCSDLVVGRLWSCKEPVQVLLLPRFPHWTTGLCWISLSLCLHLCLYALSCLFKPLRMRPRNLFLCLFLLLSFKIFPLDYSYYPFNW